VKITITADVVAWYAAIVGTLALAVNVYLARRDRAHLTVTARSGYRVTPGAHSYSPDKLYINITVANCGRRSTTVSRVWLTRKGKPGALVLSESFLPGSRELKEGTSTLYIVDQSEMTSTRSSTSMPPMKPAVSGEVGSGAEHAAARLALLDSGPALGGSQ
jgi:hypothetical protein